MLSPQVSGLVAQLGERTVRIRKVEGSIPFESTNNKNHPLGWFFVIVTVFTSKGIEQLNAARMSAAGDG